jgi:hypothetical protein
MNIYKIQLFSKYIIPLSTRYILECLRRFRRIYMSSNCDYKIYIFMISRNVMQEITRLHMEVVHAINVQKDINVPTHLNRLNNVQLDIIQILDLQIVQNVQRDFIVQILYSDPFLVQEDNIEIHQVHIHHALYVQQDTLVTVLRSYQNHVRLDIIVQEM